MRTPHGYVTPTRGAFARLCAAVSLSGPFPRVPRIREAEERAAKERQRQAIKERDEKGRAVSTRSNLEQVETQSETKTRHRTAKATGYGASTLDKGEEISETGVCGPSTVRRPSGRGTRRVDPRTWGRGWFAAPRRRSGFG